MDIKDRAASSAPPDLDRWPDASPAVAALVRSAQALVEEGLLPVGLDAGDRPVHDVAALRAALTQVEAILGMRMARAESSGSLPFLSSGGMLSQAYWSRGRARALSRAGHLANQRPDISATWTGGSITAEHIDTAARGVAGLSEEHASAVLDGLSPLWGQAAPATVATYCSRARAIVDPPPDDPDARAQKAYGTRFLSFSVLDDTVHLTGTFARLDGELLMNTIHATSERMRVAGDGPTAAQRRADALVQLAAGAQPGVNGSAPGEGGGGGDGSSAGAGRAGAAPVLRAPSGGIVASAPIAITLTVDLDALSGSGYHLSPGETRFALCDPAIAAVATESSSPHSRAAPPKAVLGSHGGDGLDRSSHPPEEDQPEEDQPDAWPLGQGRPRRGRSPRIWPPPGGNADSRDRLARLTLDSLAAPHPLAVGRAQRIATPAQRRALAVRDGGCILPGCDVRAAQCQVHHLQPWTEGGCTDLPNLVTLCWAHHRQVELGRWDIHPLSEDHPGTPANNGAPFTVRIRPRTRWGARR